MSFRPPFVLAALAALTVTGFAHADKFYLRGRAGDPESAQTYIEGVLVRAIDGVYEIRVEGGEIRLARSQVVKIEKDGLTLEALEKREQGKAQHLREADARRHEVRAAEASAEAEAAEKREADLRAQEAAEPQTLHVIVHMGEPYQPMAVYDPVLHVSRPVVVMPGAH